MQELLVSDPHRGYEEEMGRSLVKSSIALYHSKERIFGGHQPPGCSPIQFDPC